MKKKGFTLVELIIVIVIVGILTVIAVPIYRGYTQKAKWSEGKALAAAILTGQKVYYAEKGTWYEITAWVEYDDVIATNAMENKYFRKYKTGVSDKYVNVICAEVFSENEDIILYQFWPLDMTAAAVYPKWLVTDSGGGIIAEEW